MAGSHRPYAELDTVRCRDCRWAQAVNEDLHRENPAALLDWHAAHPEQGFDHLSDRDFGMALKVPDYVQWSDDGSGCLAIADERTGGYCGGYNHQCLAVFASVAGTGGLESAVTREARELGISRKLARDDIVPIAAGLYRAGLLQPASAGATVS